MPSLITNLHSGFQITPIVRIRNIHSIKKVNSKNQNQKMLKKNRIIKSRLLDIFFSMRRVKTAIIEITAKTNHKSIPRAGSITSIAGDCAIYAAAKA